MQPFEECDRTRAATALVYDNFVGPERNEFPCTAWTEGRHIFDRETFATDELIVGFRADKSSKYKKQKRMLANCLFGQLQKLHQMAHF
jgi:hypothetical protein